MRQDAGEAIILGFYDKRGLKARGKLPFQSIMVSAFFDFDDTLLEGDSILYWLRYYYRRRPLRRFFLVANWLGIGLYLVRMISNHSLKRIFLLPMAYETPEELDRLAQDFVHCELIRYLYPEIVERLRTHHLLGHQIVIISASAGFYLKHLCEGLPPCVVLGTEVVFPRQGWLRIPRYRDGNLKGKNKIRRILRDERMPSSGMGCFAYSDHHSDVFLLEFAEFPICVGPNRKLRNLAKARGWPIFSQGLRHSRLRRLISKLRLLLFAAGGAPGPAPSASPADGIAPEHLEALLGRVALKYPRDRNADLYGKIFGPAI